eukprot:TRINITY_DN25943_c0_g1_i1.p1 TRINITY_DN25943_c0_g1~~TRINITY_DN25943_c0_g1_i1.p1  ORF type:complete len:1113 (+),score=270.68 TRINITY_DN25943_c0_g1_i1:61-3399(+)
MARLPVLAVSALIGLLPIGTLHSLGPGSKSVDVEWSTFNDDLEAWIAGIRFIIPDMAFPLVQHELAEISIRELSCIGLRIGEVENQKRTSGGLGSRVDKDTLFIDVLKVSFSCRGGVGYKVPPFMGDAEVTVTTDDAMIGFGLQLVSSDVTPPLVPSALDIRGCHSILNLQLKITDGTFITRVVELVPNIMKAIQDAMNDAVQNYLCGQLLPHLKPQVNAVLGNVHAKLQRFLHAPALGAPPSDPSYVDWGQVPLIQWLMRLQDGLFTTQTPLNDMIARIFPARRVCVLGSGDTCIQSEVCVVGKASDKNCLLASAEPSALMRAFRVGLKNVEAIFNQPRVTLAAPMGASVRSRLRDRNVSVSAAFNIDFLAALRPPPSPAAAAQAAAAAAAAGGATPPELQVPATEFLQHLAGIAELEVKLFELDIASLLFAGLDQQSFAEVSSYDYVHPECLKPSIRQLQLLDVQGKVGSFVAKIRLKQSFDRTSPLLEEVGIVANNALASLQQYNAVFIAAFFGFLRSQGTSSIDNWANSLAPDACPQRQGEETDGRWASGPPIRPALGHALVKIASVFGALALFVLALRVGLRCWQALTGGDDKAGYAGAKGSPSLPPIAGYSAGPIVAAGDGPTPSAMLSHFVASGEGDLEPLKPAASVVAFDGCWFSDALCRCACVSRSMAAFVLFVILFCTFLFAGSNFISMAVSEVTLEAEPVVVPVYQIMPYALIFSIKRLLSNNLKGLAYLLLAFSGVLPYMKLLLMLLAWLAPGRLLRPRLRGRILILIDEIGKFSLVDVFVIQFINAALFCTLYLDGPQGDPIQLGVRTREQFGFLAFVTATVGSLLIGHVCLYYHKMDPLAEPERSDVVVAARERARLFLRGRDAPEKPAAAEASTWHLGYIGPLLVLLFSVVLLAFGVPAFSVRLIIGGRTFRNASYSLIEFVWSMPSFSEDPSSFETLFSKWTFVVFVLCTIELHLLTLVLVWFCGFAPRYWDRLNTLAHALFAWSALDVALLSMVVTLLEMQTSDFMHLKETQMATLGNVLGWEITDPRMLRLDVTLEWGTYVLIGCVLVHAWLGRVAMRVLDQAALGHRDHLARGSAGATSCSDGEEDSEIPGRL